MGGSQTDTQTDTPTDTQTDKYFHLLIQPWAE
jgi:hypothetical protein